MRQFTILAFGDVVGSLGRSALLRALPGLKQRYAPQLTLANVENLTHGAGISLEHLELLSAAGVDAFTSGNHVWTNLEGSRLLDDPAWRKRLIRPGNMRRGEPGQGSVVIQAVDGTKVLLMNLMGQVLFPESVESPFHALDATLAAHAADRPDCVILDFHAEATAEKEALGHYADGRVALVYGTHTHVPTADAKILPGGTAYCTDLGRVGSSDSVLGFEKKSAIERFLQGGKLSYALEQKGVAEVNGWAVWVDLDTGRTVGLDRIREFVEC